MAIPGWPEYRWWPMPWLLDMDRQRVRFNGLARCLPALVAAFTASAAAAADLHVASGDRLAHNLCINCHVVDTQSPVLRTDRVPSFSWIANQPGETSTRITVWLSISHERMPDYTLSDEQIEDLAAYIMSLRVAPAGDPALHKAGRD